jgi:hypothetical protein
MRILWCVLFIISVQLSFAQSPSNVTCLKTDLHKRIPGTQLFAVIPETVFEKSPDDPKIWYNTKDEVAIAFEAKAIGFKEYNDFMVAAIKKAGPTMTIKLSCDDYKGELMKIDSKQDNTIMWFGFLSNDRSTIEFKGMFKKAMEKNYDEIIQNVFTSVLVDKSVIIDEYEDLPYSTNSKKYNFTKAGSFMPLSLTLSDNKEPASLITITYFEKSTTDEDLPEEADYTETISGTNKTIKMKWGPREDEEVVSLDFKANIEFERSVIIIRGSGPKNSDFLNNMKDITKSTELK